MHRDIQVRGNLIVLTGCCNNSERPAVCRCGEERARRITYSRHALTCVYPNTDGSCVLSFAGGADSADVRVGVAYDEVVWRLGGRDG